jgi:hypothetical protein
MVGLGVVPSKKLDERVRSTPSDSICFLLLASKHTHMQPGNEVLSPEWRRYLGSPSVAPKTFAPRNPA